MKPEIPESLLRGQVQPGFRALGYPSGIAFNRHFATRSKYLSGLRKLDHVLVLKAGFETQLRTPCLLIPCGMRALSMTRQIREGRLQSGIQPRAVPGLQGLHQVT